MSSIHNAFRSLETVSNMPLFIFLLYPRLLSFYFLLFFVVVVVVVCCCCCSGYMHENKVWFLWVYRLCIAKVINLVIRRYTIVSKKEKKRKHSCVQWEERGGGRRGRLRRRGRRRRRSTRMTMAKNSTTTNNNSNHKTSDDDKDLVVHVKVRWIMETLKYPAGTLGWVTRLCRSWLFPGKATRRSLGRNPIGTIHL